MTGSRAGVVCTLLGAAVLVSSHAASSLAVSPHAATQMISIRGHAQRLYIYGRPTGDPVIVSSGDGGWMHLAPDIAAFLASHGFYVIGFDVKAYLESFSDGGRSLNPGDEPGDYRAIIDAATRITGKRPILAGVSEGAGLSVLAASDPVVKFGILGVIGLGAPETTELAWRWQDDVIYVTHKPPNEPSFRTSAVAAQLSPVPFAAIYSTHDEFIPASEIAAIVGHAREPKRLWMVDATNHRFSGNTRAFNERLLEAVRWVNERAVPLDP